jgi:YD repeat-containing protein
VLGYDVHGHLHTITDPEMHTRTLHADRAGLVTSIVDATDAVTSFEYDEDGNRAAVQDAANDRTTFAYDGQGRLTSVTDAAGNTTATEYDEEGNVTARVDAFGRRTEYRYDASGRLFETVNAARQATTLGYCADVAGQPCVILDPAGNVSEGEPRPRELIRGRSGRTADPDRRPEMRIPASRFGYPNRHVPCVAGRA